MFDHTTIVAKDDPKIDYFKTLSNHGLIQLRIIEDVGCEKFAKYVFDYINEIIQKETDKRVKVIKVESFEGGTNNSAIYQPIFESKIIHQNFKKKINSKVAS